MYKYVKLFRIKARELMSTDIFKMQKSHPTGLDVERVAHEAHNLFFSGKKSQDLN